MSSPENGKRSSRDLLLEAAGEIMRDSGYAAVTSRKLAARAGLKPQLVHYHFRSMDDLFVELYRKYAAEMLEKQQGVLKAKNPLREMWKVAGEARGVLLTEFLSLANHRKVISREIADFGNRFRRRQIEIMEQVLSERRPEGFPDSPAMVAFLINCISRGLAVEGEFAINEGHAETLVFIEELLAQFDPEK